MQASNLEAFVASQQIARDAGFELDDKMNAVIKNVLIAAATSLNKYYLVREQHEYVAHCSAIEPDCFSQDKHEEVDDELRE
jgi:hypothetical protein